MRDQSLPVSVVICAFNAQPYIKKALKSIREQTYRNLEIIVIDDGSADSTAAIVSAESELDSRISLIRLDRNSGIAHARQIGLERSSHNWMQFLDSDDVALPTMIERQVATVLTDDKNILGVSTYSYFIGEDEKTIIGEQKVGILTKEDFFGKVSSNKLIFILPNTLFSRAHAIAVGGYRLSGFPAGGEIRYQDFSEDVDLWCRMSDFGAEGKYFITIPEPLFLYRKIAGSVSTANVFWMQQKMRWIKDCLSRRRAGQAEIEFEAYRNGLSVFQRINNLRCDYAAFLYKRMGFCYLRGQYVRAGLLVATVSLLDPRFAIQKLKTQSRGMRT